ncbi:hypothetical protein CHS0354_040388 [Potamilus streckersoni]|uniref:Uncharacterized protein n=1 Tax=Potamilus streckersoni TaxID=2493646 RepID=A0AAE0S1L4_9BIVA|nr:hypothetical protein CHS0354_040388 [Potamilus streckersoni]
MSCLSRSPNHGKVRVRNAQSQPQESEQKKSKLMEIVNCLFFRRKKNAEVVDMVEEEKQAILPKERKIHVDRSNRSRKALKMENMKDGPVHRRVVKSAPSTPCGTRYVAFLPSEHPTDIKLPQDPMAAFMSYLSPKDRTIRQACSVVSRSYSASNLARLHARQAFLQTQQQQRRHVITSRRSSDIPLYKRRPWQMDADDMNIGITKVSRADKQKLGTCAPGVISDSKEDAFYHSTDDIYDLHEEMRRMRLSNPNLKMDVMSTSTFIEEKNVRVPDQELILVNDQSQTPSASSISMESSTEDLCIQTQQKFSAICRKALNSSDKNEQVDEAKNKTILSDIHQSERRLSDGKAVTRKELYGEGLTMDEDGSESVAEEGEVNFDAFLNRESSCANMERNCFLMKGGENDFTREIRSNEIGDGKSRPLFVDKNQFDGGPMKVTPVRHIGNINKRDLTLRKNNRDESENGRARFTEMNIRLYDEKEDEDDSDIDHRDSPMISMITSGDATMYDSKLVPLYLRPRSQEDNLINNSEQSTLQSIHTPVVETERHAVNKEYCTKVISNGDRHGQEVPNHIDPDQSFSSEFSETSEIMNLLKKQCDQQNIMAQHSTNVSRSSRETLTPFSNVSSTHSAYVTIPPCQSDINSSRPYLSSQKKRTLALHNKDVDEEEEKSVYTDNLRMMQNKSGTNSSSQSIIKSLNAQSTPPPNRHCIMPIVHVRNGQLQPLPEVPSVREQNKNRLPFKNVEVNFPIGIGSGAIFREARTVRNVRLDPIQSSQRPFLDIPLGTNDTNKGNTERFGFSSQVGHATVPWQRSKTFVQNLYSNEYGNLSVNHSHDTGYNGIMGSKPDDSPVQSLSSTMLERKDKHLVQCAGYSVNDTSHYYDNNVKQEHGPRGNKDRDKNAKQNHDLKPFGTTKTTETENNLYSSIKSGVKIKPIPPRETRRGLKLEWLLKEAAETEV